LGLFSKRENVILVVWPTVKGFFDIAGVSLSQEHLTHRFGRENERVCSRGKCGKQACNAKCESVIAITEKYRFRK